MTDRLQPFFRSASREIPCRKRAGSFLSVSSVSPGNRPTGSAKTPSNLPTPRIEEAR